METNSEHQQNSEKQASLNNKASLLDHTNQELREMAKDLSEGKYKDNIQQRDRLLQLLVKQLSSIDPI